jgi:hypothetical protein
MRTVLLFLVVIGFQNTFGQTEGVEYKIFSDVLVQLEKNRTQHAFLLSDSTIPFLIDLSGIEPYIHDKTDKNLKLSKAIFPYFDLLNEMWTDTAVYSLIVAHNKANKTANPVIQKFTKELSVDIFEGRNNVNWDLLYKRYPNSGGLRTFSRPAIIHDRAVVVLEWMQAGNAGETILLLTRLN